MAPIHKAVTSVEACFFQGNLNMRESSRTTENGDNGTRPTNPEDSLPPVGAPSLVLNDVLPVPLIPTLVSHAASEPAPVRNVLHEGRAVLDPVDTPCYFSVVPFSTDEFVVVGWISDATGD